MDIMLFIKFDSFSGVLSLIFLCIAVIVSTISLLIKDPKGETLRKEHWLRKKKGTENLT
ncbi:MAG: hypothetical protein NTZ83_00340 [Candidatus Pacearchaeota archaeon]|nr:hypothetical protein [Candidatus Pacearchaeota archaeon]